MVAVHTAGAQGLRSFSWTVVIFIVKAFVFAVLIHRIPRRRIISFFLFTLVVSSFSTSTASPNVSLAIVVLLFQALSLLVILIERARRGHRHFHLRLQLTQNILHLHDTDTCCGTRRQSNAITAVELFGRLDELFGLDLLLLLLLQLLLLCLELALEVLHSCTGPFAFADIVRQSASL